jgi:NodT family efflux transporter outer membrane factor (OMF) lipoprotein
MVGGACKTTIVQRLLYGALLVSSGCAVGPDYRRPPVAVNGSWSAKADARLTTQKPLDPAWWRTFHDPTLDRLVDLAYRQNLPFQVAGLRILEARAHIGIAIGRQYPSNQNPIASVTGLGINGEQPTGNALNLYLGSYQVGFDAVYEADIWGKFRRGVKAAKAGYLATVADFDDATVSLTAEVARTYLLIRTVQVRIAIARENVGVQEEGLRIAESRFRNGATSGLDVSQAANLLESTKATIPELQIDLQRAEDALCTLLARPPGCDQPLLTGPVAIPTPPAQVAIGMPAELLRRRPDIRAAELNAIAQCNRIGAAKADLFPHLTLSGLIGTRTVGTTGTTTAFGSLLGIFSLGTLLYSLGADLFWPILNYPIILNNVRVEDARFQQLLFDYQNVVLRAQQEVEDGIAGFLREQEAAVFAQNAVSAAQESVRLSIVQYREGAVDYQRVNDSQRSLLQSQDSLVRIQSAVATNLVALYKALGGGWELRQGIPFVDDSTRGEMQKRTNWGHYFARPPKIKDVDGPPPTSR